MTFLNASDFRALVGGQKRGPAAAGLRGLLRAAELPYSLAVRWRNRRYDSGRAQIARVDCPVISVGNLTLGGTGKTPFVEWLARWFGARGARVALVSRGYGAEKGAKNDEARELEQRLPCVPHILNPDRVAAARQVIAEHSCDVILLDDGFQHRRLARDLDVVLLDAACPFGYGHVFPRGLLREPVAGLARAQVVALSRADMIDPAARQAIRDQAMSHSPNALWLEVRHAPVRLRTASGREEPLVRLQGSRVAAFAGIGNPEGFRHTLVECGCEIAAYREFPDHHAYSNADLASLATWAAGHEVDAVVTTHKDLVKFSTDKLEGRPLWAVEVGLEFTLGLNDFEVKLRAIV